MERKSVKFIVGISEVKFSPTSTCEFTAYFCGPIKYLPLIPSDGSRFSKKKEKKMRKIDKTHSLSF